MAKILRSETSLGRRENELRRELARTFWLRLAAWGPVAVLSVLLAVAAVRRASPWPLAGIPVLALLGLGVELRRREMADEVRNLEGGRRGENKMASILAERLADDHLVLNDLELRLGHDRAQIDHLVLAPSGIYVIESKYWAGTLSGDVVDSNWTQKNRGFPRTVKSPVKQCERQRRMLISLFNLRLPDDRIHPMAVFTHPRARLEIRGAEGRVFTLNQAVRYINDHCFDPPVLTPSALRSLADDILRHQT